MNIGIQRIKAALAVLFTVALLAMFVTSVWGAPRIPRSEIEELRAFGINPVFDPAASPGAGTTDVASCTTTGDPSADIDISCDDPIAPDNELAIVANPEDPDHLLAGSNDYQLYFRGNTAIVRIPVGSFVSFDGGVTWHDSQVPLGNSSLGTGDPAPAFNVKFDTVHMASLGFVCGQFSPFCTRGNIQVATSHDGGLTWERPVTVANGIGADVAAQQVFNDKEWLIADNNPASPYFGRLYLVWVAFRIEKGGYDESPVMFSYSDDAGQNWSAPMEISGRNEQFCTFQDDANDVLAGEDAFECDQDQFAYPAVGPGGVLYVHFHNEQNQQAWEAPEMYESQIMVVKSTDGGATWSDPVHVVQMEDSYTAPPVGAAGDYPLNVQNRTTLTGHQMRVNSAGNIAVDPNSGVIYIVFADNADGTNSSANPVTDTNIFLAYSMDGGASWVGGDDGSDTDLAARIRVDASGGSDQWFPWVDVDPVDGSVHVLYMDGRADRDLYDITLASSTDMGASFSHEVVSQEPSNPDNSLFFRSGAPGCEGCATFIGDYNGLAVDMLGRAHGVWTDMRRVVTADGRTVEDAFYARR